MKLDATLTATIILMAAGMAGGLITHLSWKIESIQSPDPTKKTDYLKLARNLLLGAASAVFLISTTTPNAFPTTATPQLIISAFFMGLGGEFLIQKSGKAVSNL